MALLGKCRTHFAILPRLHLRTASPRIGHLIGIVCGYFHPARMAPCVLSVDRYAKRCCLHPSDFSKVAGLCYRRHSDARAWCRSEYLDFQRHQISAAEPTSVRDTAALDGGLPRRRPHPDAWYNILRNVG